MNNILFKKNDTGEEIREVTGNWFIIQSTTSIWGEIIEASHEVELLIGPELMQFAVKEYNQNRTEKHDLVMLLQRAVAMLAALRYYHRTDVSHDINGRKIKIDQENEKIPWEWQLLDDDREHMEAHYRAIDMAIALCERDKIKEWINSEKRKEHSSLLINTLSKFERYYPIGGSYHTFLSIVPFMREVERDNIIPVLAEDYTKFLSGETGGKEIVFEKTCSALILMSISKTMLRRPVNLFPNGIGKLYMSSSQTQRATENISYSEIKTISSDLWAQAQDIITDIKRLRNSETPTVILPRNNRHNKFFNI